MSNPQQPAGKRVRMVVTLVGNRNTGKSTTVKSFVDRHLNDVLIYSTPGDKAFNGYLRTIQDPQVYLRALERYNACRKQPIGRGTMTPIFAPGNTPYPEPVAVQVGNNTFAAYVQGITPDGRSAVLLVNNEQDYIDCGSTRLALPPNRTLTQRINLSPVTVPLAAIARTRRLMKVQMPKSHVEFWSQRQSEITMSKLFPRMENQMFVISDASSLLAEDRTYNRALHDIVTQCRHQGTDLFMIVHKLENLHKEQFTQSNYIIFHKQGVRAEIPPQLRRELDDDRSQELLDIIKRVEAHSNPFYNETFVNFAPGDDVLDDTPYWG